LAGNLLLQQERTLQQGYADCCAALSQSFYKLKDYSAMIRIAEMAQQSGFFDKSQFYFYLGLAAYGLNDYGKAVTLLQQSISLNAANPEAFAYMGLSLQTLNKADVAAQFLLQAQRLGYSGSDSGFALKNIKLKIF
jgi:tetratricopeptide (TPR) repeat protein